MPGLVDLPGDVADLIFARLPCEDKHFRLAQICAFHRSIAYAPEIWRHVELSPRFNLHALHDASQRLHDGAIRHISVCQPCKALPATSSVTPDVLRAASKANSFELRFSEGLHGHHFEKLRQLWNGTPELREVAIRCNRSPLEHHPVSVLDWLPLFSVLAGTRAAESVTSLEIGSDPHYGFPEFAIPERLRSFCAGLQSMVSLSSLTLRSLHLSGHAVAGLPAMPHVTRLAVSHSRHWPRAASAGFFEGLCLRMPALQEIDLSPSDARDTTLALVLRECPLLRRLRMSACGSLCDPRLQDCGRLEEVALEGASLRCLSVENCDRLRSLSVESEIRSSGVRLTVLLRCPGLRELRLLYPFFGVHGDEVYPPRLDVYAPALRRLEVRCRRLAWPEVEALSAASAPLSAAREAAFDPQYGYALLVAR